MSESWAKSDFVWHAQTPPLGQFSITITSRKAGPAAPEVRVCTTPPSGAKVKLGATSGCSASTDAALWGP